MLYTASYFEPENHHGQLISASRSRPKSITVASSLKFLAPSAALLKDWKIGITEDTYTDRYRSEIRDNWTEVKDWLDTLDPQVDATLCCWEKAGDFCHRNMIAKLVSHYRSDCFGGCDVATEPTIEPSPPVTLKLHAVDSVSSHWDRESDRALYEWLLSQSDDSLPKPPFQLYRAVTVTGNGFYESLKGEARSSLEFLNGERDRPTCRHLSGALQSTIKRVWELQAEVEGAIAHANCEESV